MTCFSMLARLRLLCCAMLVALTWLNTAAADEAMEFPRNALTWYLSGDADRLWQHAGPVLRELVQDVDGLRGVAAEIDEMMGPQTALLDEQIFDHPEGAGFRVYVGRLLHAKVSEIFWVVVFHPAKREVGMIIPQPRQTIQTLFPEVRLP
jgi:hypothetical protein